MPPSVTTPRKSSSNRKRPGTISIRDVARRAGVSIATVSRVVNGIPTVDPELAKRVWQVINEVGYFPNTQARALVSGRSRMLGLIVSEITNPFFPELVQEFESLAMKCSSVPPTTSPNAPSRLSAACCSATSTASPS
jgi:LacI family transcriptional regulator